MDNMTKMKYHRIMYLLYKLYNQEIIAEVGDGIYDLNLMTKKLIDANYNLSQNLKHTIVVLKTVREIEKLTVDEFEKNVDSVNNLRRGR